MTLSEHRSETVGRDETTPVVLLGGVAEDDDLWLELKRDLAGCRTCDARPSSTPGRSMVDAAAAVAGTLSGQVIVVGHSMGGLVGLELARLRPDLVAGLVLVCVGYPVEVNPRIYELLERDLGEGARALAVAASGGGGRQDHPDARWVADRFEKMASRTDASRVVIDLRACESYRMDPWATQTLPRIRVLSGAEDRMLPQASIRKLASALGVGADVVPDAGHQLSWERPELIASACRQLRRELAV